jgi:multiple sugar transport system ATP-binding protein
VRAEAISYGTPVEGCRRVVDATVEVTEPTGADTLVVLSLGGHEFTARLQPDFPLKPGQRGDFCVDLAKLVLFDPQSEQLIA